MIPRNGASLKSGRSTTREGPVNSRFHCRSSCTHRCLFHQTVFLVSFPGFQCVVWRNQDQSQAQACLTEAFLQSPHRRCVGIPSRRGCSTWSYFQARRCDDILHHKSSILILGHGFMIGVLGADVHSTLWQLSLLRGWWTAEAAQLLAVRSGCHPAPSGSQLSWGACASVQPAHFLFNHGSFGQIPCIQRGLATYKGPFQTLGGPRLRMDSGEQALHSCTVTAVKVPACAWQPFDPYMVEFEGTTMGPGSRIHQAAWSLSKV